MDVSTPQDRRGTRRVMMGGAAAAVLVGIALLVWMLVPGYDRHQSTTDATGARFGQDQGTSTVGSSPTPPDATAAAPDPIAIGRNQGISATAENQVQLT